MVGSNTPANWVTVSKIEPPQRVRCSPKYECFQHPRFGCTVTSARPRLARADETEGGIMWLGYYSKSFLDRV